MSIRTRNTVGIVFSFVAGICLSQLLAAFTQNNEWLLIGEGSDGSINYLPAYGLGIFIGLPLALAAMALFNFGKRESSNTNNSKGGTISNLVRKSLTLALLALLLLGSLATIMLLIAFSML
jgi:hypothetical protein